MKESWISKSLVFIIILLFSGIAVAPNINQNIVKASHDDDLVEVTTQACGIKGYKDTTVKLTREQYQNLELYLVEFRARLNKTTTREEAIPIFKEAVVELDRYGVLPKGMLTKHPVVFIIVEIQLFIRLLRGINFELISVAEIPEAPDEIVFPLLYLYSLWLWTTFSIESELWTKISDSLGWNWPSFPF